MTIRWLALLAIVANAVSFAALAEAPPRGPVFAQETALARQGTLTVDGSYPGYFRRLPDGAIDFIAFTNDGDHRALHVLSGAHEQILGLLEADEVPFAWSDGFILSGARRSFIVRDAKTGAILRRREFEGFYPPVPPQTSWLDRDVLTMISGDQSGGSTLRRIHLPDLQVIEHLSAPFTGTYARWGDNFVGVGYSPRSSYPPRPSIAVLDRHFHLLARSDIEDSRPRDRLVICPLGGFAEPLVVDDTLVYGADCGGIRLHDLRRMQQIASCAPIDSATIVSFNVVDGRLIAFGSESEQVLTVDEIALPTLRPTRLLRVEGKYVIASGANVYAFEDQGSPLRNMSQVTASRIPGRAASVPSLSDSIVSAQRAAEVKLQQAGDIFTALEAMRTAVPKVLPGDLPSLTPAAKAGIAWYAGLLVQTHRYAKEGSTLLDALQQEAPRDERLSRLHEAAEAWAKVISPAAGSEPSPLVPSPSSVSPGILGGAIARNERYLVTTRWCGMVEGNEKPDLAPRATLI
jgi:hypothetical protein